MRTWTYTIAHNLVCWIGLWDWIKRDPDLAGVPKDEELLLSHVTTSGECICFRWPTRQYARRERRRESSDVEMAAKVQRVRR